MPQPIGTDFAATFHPLADRPFADTKGFGNPTLGPTFLCEAPGLKAPRFLPVLRRRGHAYQGITRWTYTLDLNVLVCSTFAEVSDIAWSELAGRLHADPYSPVNNGCQC